MDVVMSLGGPAIPVHITRRIGRHDRLCRSQPCPIAVPLPVSAILRILIWSVEAADSMAPQQDRGCAKVEEIPIFHSNWDMVERAGPMSE